MVDVNLGLEDKCLRPAAAGGGGASVRTTTSTTTRGEQNRDRASNDSSAIMRGEGEVGGRTPSRTCAAPEAVIMTDQQQLGASPPGRLRVLAADGLCLLAQESATTSA